MPTYWTKDNCTYMDGKDGSDQLCNFVARIVEENIYHDGVKKTTVLKIDGCLHDSDKEEGTPLPMIEVTANDFASMGWVADQWGMRPIIYPTASAERNLRTAIQQESKPLKRDIYTHTGWDTINGRRTYLSASGGIHAKGFDKGITVRLPSELSMYKLPPPAISREAFGASLNVSQIGPPHIITPMILAAYRAAIAPCDFAIHLAGRTGTYKSEIASLIQSHFGKEMDARHLPASWSSTANALEHLAYRAANAVMVMDDFVPLGTSWQVRQLQKSADQIIRGQGNQQGRSRLTDVSQMQTTYYPRGLLISTGEDVPEGHSVRGRMLILEISPGDVTPAALSKAQAARDHYPQAMADWIQWLAQTDAHKRIGPLAKSIRDQHLQVGHARTPQMIGELIATATLLAEYGVSRKFITDKVAAHLIAASQEAVLTAADNQRQHLQVADPVTALMETIRQCMASKTAHVKTRNGGVPVDSELYGWTEQASPGEQATFKHNGPRIGWVDTEKGEFLLDPSSLTFLKKWGGGRLAVTPQTLMKRLKEAGVLTRTDDTRQRNTVRVTCEGHSRQVLSFQLDEVMDDEKVEA